MKKSLKRLSIFFISILGVTFHQVISHDDCSICCIIDKDGIFLIQDNYHVFSNDCNNYTLFKCKDIITSYTLRRTYLTRAPPA